MAVGQQNGHTGEGTLPITARGTIQAALDSSVDYTDIRVFATWPRSERESFTPGKVKMFFELTVPANFAVIDLRKRNHMIVDIAAVARCVNRDIVANFSQRIDTHLNPRSLERIQRSGMTYSNHMRLVPGDYNVRFVIRDAIGNRIGSVSSPVSVPP